MFKSYKWFLICRRYEKDIWGYIIAKHKTVNLGWIKVWPNIENVPHLAKKKRLLQEFSKKLSNSGLKILNFSFEIVRRMWKKKPKKMKNWMRFFFLARILWIFYGNLKKHKFLNFCNLCIAKKAKALFFFLKIFEFWIPMFIYRMGFAPSLIAATTWLTSGLIFKNNKIVQNIWQPLNLYDYISFDPVLWPAIITNLAWLFYYGSKAAKWRRCISTKLWSSEWLTRAHFISFPTYTYIDIKTLSFYWWKEATPDSLKYYFSVNPSHILKYVTI